MATYKLAAKARRMGVSLARAGFFVGIGCLSAQGARAADAVTSWTLLADHLGHGAANWHSLAIMHIAMHDAYNAAKPTYARWFPPAANESAVQGAMPEAAMAAAAHEVLIRLQPEDKAAIEDQFTEAEKRLPAGSGLEAGLRLGAAIGAAAVARRQGDGSEQHWDFPVSDVDGKWRPDPITHLDSPVNHTRPFLFASADEAPAPTPPALGSPEYIQVVEEVRRLGSLNSTERTDAQTDAGLFWASQSCQRGYAHLAASLLDRNPRPGGIAEHARIMSQLAAGLADSAIIAWQQKERFDYWRPITVIRQGGYGITPDPNWRPLVATPPFPEYPSGHATDCFVGAGVLAAVFGDNYGPVTYVAQLAAPANTSGNAVGDQYSAAQGASEDLRQFPNLPAAAEECYWSRIWVGVHFRSGEDQGRRLGKAIVARALQAVPPVN
jgi:hypothetical protein